MKEKEIAGKDRFRMYEENGLRELWYKDSSYLQVQAQTSTRNFYIFLSFFLVSWKSISFSTVLKKCELCPQRENRAESYPKHCFQSDRCGQDISYPPRLHSDTGRWKGKCLWNFRTELRQLRSAQGLRLALPPQALGLEMLLLSRNTNFKAWTGSWWLAGSSALLVLLQAASVWYYCYSVLDA